MFNIKETIEYFNYNDKTVLLVYSLIYNWSVSAENKELMKKTK